MLDRVSRRRGARIAWTALGTVSLTIGVVGVVVPVLPTTPFLLLAAFCYARGSKRFHAWLIGAKVLGPYIRNYQEGKRMSTSAKLTTIVFLWMTMLATIALLDSDLIIKLLIAGVAVAVTAHIATLRPARREQGSEQP